MPPKDNKDEKEEEENRTNNRNNTSASKNQNAGTGNYDDEETDSR